MRKEEMMRFQGVVPIEVKRVVPWPELGNQIGNSLSPNVIERILWALLPAAGLGNNPFDDRWKNGKAMQELRKPRIAKTLIIAEINTEPMLPTARSKLHEFVWYDSPPTYELRPLPKSSYAPDWENVVTVIHRCASTYQILFHENVDDKSVK